MNTSTERTKVEGDVVTLPAGARPDGDVMVRCRGLVKRFGPMIANENIDLDIRAGTVHALVGENGAGKSTLLGMISGRLEPTGGRIQVAGEELPTGHPRAIRSAGVVAIYQELTMVPALSAVENVFLGQVLTTGPFVARSRMARRFAELAYEFGIDINPDAPAETLPLAQQQVLEIMRGVQAEAKVLLLDEPSAALSIHERESLASTIRRLRDGGTTIVIVSHNLDEVLALADDVSVMRDGRLIRTAPRESWTRESLIAAMVGEETPLDVTRAHRPVDEVLMRCTDIVCGPGAAPISFDLRRGEVLGLWGLMGSGRTSLLKTLAGLHRHTSGTVEIAGEAAPVADSVRSALKRGIALLPEDRKGALVLGLDSIANVHIGRKKRSRIGWIAKRAEFEEGSGLVGRFRLPSEKLRQPVASLSGGNQQKVLFAKWIGWQPSILLIDEPTRGIDVAAKAEVLNALSRLADDGMGVVMTSSELEEVMAVCDRLIVFSGGRPVATLHADDPGFNAETIVGLGFQQPEGIEQ